jgi:aconitate hydratase
LTGVITDPRTLGISYPKFDEPEKIIINIQMLLPPPSGHETFELEIGPNIKPLPQFDPLPNVLQGPVLIKLGDDISTDTIMPAGTKVLPFRSNIPEISKFTFSQADASFYERAMKFREGGSLVVGGSNYGQGSSREHAALGPRYLGVKAVIAKSFARIHWQNLINFGILPLVFINPNDYDGIMQGDVLLLSDIRNQIARSRQIEVYNKSQNKSFTVVHSMSERQLEMMLKGSLINIFREKHIKEAQ